MKRKRVTWGWIGSVAVAMALGLVWAGGAQADCGSIPFEKPLLVDSFEILPSQPQDVAGGTSGPKEVRFNPLKVSVFEPQQRAIILWNGQEEVLLLSTDQKATQQSAVLEVIPLPAEPSIRLGSFETFEAAQKLMVEKRMWACAHGGVRADAVKVPEPAARITFQQKMGAHDLTVAQALDRQGFVQFVQGYLQSKYGTRQAPIRSEFVEVIQSYLEEGFQWFAFDVITLGDSLQTRQPIEYRFRSNQVFYPLRISKLELGTTRVDLLVFTPGSAVRFVGLPGDRIHQEPLVPVSVPEVEGLDSRWTGFFRLSPDSKLTLNQWNIEGELSTFTQDVKAQ